MKKLKLFSDQLKNAHVLSREQLKAIIGGSGSGGCTAVGCCTVTCSDGKDKDRECQAGTNCTVIGTTIYCGTGDEGIDVCSGV